jgi:hypothetical protein
MGRPRGGPLYDDQEPSHQADNRVLQRNRKAGARQSDYCRYASDPSECIENHDKDGQQPRDIAFEAI